MGTFTGHLLPGGLFVLLGLWWAVMASLRHRRSRRRGAVYLSTSSFTLDSQCCLNIRRWPVEPTFKVVTGTVGLISEIMAGFRNGKFAAWGDAQHSTIYLSFLCSGIIDYLVYFRVPLPLNTDYAMLTLTFLIEGILLKFHLHGRTPLDVLLHTLIEYTVFATAVSVLAEIRFRRHLLVSLIRAYLLILQGTWLVQIGFVLYSAEPWKADGHNEMTTVTLFFAWHALADFILVVLISTLMGNCFDTKVTDFELLSTSENSDLTFFKEGCDSDFEVELQ